MTLPAMVFAAGRGTRMGPLTASRPKPLIDVSGRSLLDHALDLVEAVAARPVVVNSHYLADQVAGHLAGRDIQISHEPRLLETGGGLRNALPLLGGGPVFTLNSDAVWAGPNPLARLLDAWDPQRMDALLMCLAPERALGHTGPGDFLQDEAGRLRRGAGLVYAGAQILDPRLLDDIEEDAFSLNRAWDAAIARNRLYGVVHQGLWCDVGQPASLNLAEGLLAGVS